MAATQAEEDVHFILKDRRVRALGRDGVCCQAICEEALIMREATSLTTAPGVALVLAIALGGCGKTEQSDPRDAGKARAEAKRQQAACASSAAYNRMKGLLFDRAIEQHNGDRANLDTLADYSVVRMEDPVVEGWDPALDITRCKGRLILELPPGADRAFAGERRLQADIGYTAQAAADGSGFVYQLSGGEPIVAKLATFNLTAKAFRPPPAIDDGQVEADESEPAEFVEAEMPEPPLRSSPTQSEPPSARRSVPPARREAIAPEFASEREARDSLPLSSAVTTGEATVRAFYHALGAGNGSVASAQIIPEKRSSRAFSPEAISRFYGGLAEPLRLMQVVPLAPGVFRVSYRYSAGRSRCDGSAVVRLANRGDRDFVRSIDALNGC
jgi:hypothetical protein